jgi:hypothetical protein
MTTPATPTLAPELDQKQQLEFVSFNLRSPVFVAYHGPVSHAQTPTSLVRLLGQVPGEPGFFYCFEIESKKNLKMHQQQLKLEYQN